MYNLKEYNFIQSQLPLEIDLFVFLWVLGFLSYDSKKYDNVSLTIHVTFLMHKFNMKILYLICFNIRYMHNSHAKMYELNFYEYCFVFVEVLNFLYLIKERLFCGNWFLHTDVLNETSHDFVQFLG